MFQQRRKFSPQFKAEAVQLVLETGKPIAEVARDLGIYEGTLGNWVNAWRRDNPEPEQPLTPVERARVIELEEENRRLRMENEFPKQPRPSSPGRSRSRTRRADRGGEGQLLRQLDVPDARRPLLRDDADERGWCPETSHW
jgi:transposase